MMNMKKNLIVLGLMATLAACGGSDGGDEAVVVDPLPGTGTGGTGGNGGTGGDGGTGGTEPETFTVTTLVPLEKAFVCADLNEDKICQDDENLGLTDKNGSFEVDEKYASNDLIVVGKINQTIDQVTKLGIGSDYEMFAPAGSVLISPITTLSMVSGYTLADISATWGMDEDVVGSYYLENLSTVNKQSANAIRAISEFLTQQLKRDADISGLVEKIATVTPAINAAMLTGEDLSSLTLSLDPNGVLVTNLANELLEFLDWSKIGGNWNVYMFGTSGDDFFYSQTRYGLVEIDNSWRSKYCSNFKSLNDAKALDVDATKSCVSSGVYDNRLITGFDGALLNLVYGEHNVDGTVMLFKAVDDNGKHQAYYWFDNYEQVVSQGESIDPQYWVVNPLTSLGVDSEGLLGAYTRQIQATGIMDTTYSDGRTEQSYWDWSPLETFGNGIDVDGVGISYRADVDAKSAVHTIFRKGEYLSLGFTVDTAGNLDFNFTSPNAEIIDSIEKGELFQGAPVELSKM